MHWASVPHTEFLIIIIDILFQGPIANNPGLSRI